MGLSQKLLLEQCEKKKNAKTTKISIIFLIILLPSILFTPTQTLPLFLQISIQVINNNLSLIPLPFPHQNKRIEFIFVQFCLCVQKKDNYFPLHRS